MKIETTKYSDRDNGQDYDWALMNSLEAIKKIEQDTCYRYHIKEIDPEKGVLVSRTVYKHYKIDGKDYLELTMKGIERLEREERWIKCS